MNTGILCKEAHEALCEDAIEKETRVKTDKRACFFVQGQERFQHSVPQGS